MRARPHRHVAILAMGLALGLSGCASGGGGGGDTSRPAGATTNRIVAAELAEVGQIDALQAINRLRPRWTAVRGGADSPVLYVDGSRRSSLSDLSSMRATDIQTMEFMSANDATTRFGTGHTGGAIMVTTRR